MNIDLLERVQRSAPQWLRYLLTLSVIASEGVGWVVAAGDDVALFEAEGTSVMPLWPAEKLAAETPVEGAAPLGVPANELVERLLPVLGEGSAMVAVLPAEGDNTLVAPESVAQDIAGFSADPRDIAAEILAEPRVAGLEELALLETPDMSALAPCEPADAAFWMLVADEDEGVIGLLDSGTPAILLFTQEPHAIAFRIRTGAPASPKPVSADEMLERWLLFAFSTGWRVATAVDAARATVETPARLALELAEGRAPA